MSAVPRLVAVNDYTLLGPAQDFAQAAAALADRVRTEGEPGVLAYLFFADPAAGTARAVVQYRDPAAWIGHHDRSFGWPEMKALHAAARLREVALLGEVPPEIHDWLARAGLAVPLRLYPLAAAGFVRPM